MKTSQKKQIEKISLKNIERKVSIGPFDLDNAPEVNIQQLIRYQSGKKSVYDEEESDHDKMSRHNDLEELEF